MSATRSRMDSGAAKKKTQGKVEEEDESGVEPVEEAEASITAKTKDNFFDFHDDDQNVWGPNFTRSLRKTSKVFEAMPFIPDTSVEKIGGAFVEEDRSLKPLHRWTSADEGSTETDSIGPDRSLSSVSSHVEYHKIKELRMRIEELEIARWKAPSIQETIDRLLLGKTCSLSWYKSIKEKKELLDLAIATLDGNCIMAVILFIKKTVDQSILLNILEHYPVAARHYANFLKELQDWKELKVLYRRLNDYDSLGYFNLEECNKPGLEKEERIRLIKSCPILFKNLRLRHEEDVQHVEEYSRLVNKQQKIEEAAGHGGDLVLRSDSVLFRPLTTTLLYCCKHHRGQEHSIASPEELRKLFNIPERQYFQMDLLALSLHRDWQGIGAMLTSKGLLGFGKKKKSPIGFERVIRMLGQERYRAPDLVLVRYLEELDDLELRYELAMEIGLFDCALETLKSLRDKDRVREIINFIPPSKHYDFRQKIEGLLANSQIKWK